jgi:hypothetical protein
MNTLQNVKIVNGTNGTGSTTATTSVDTRGFSYAMIQVHQDVAGAVHTAVSNTKVEQSDDNSTWEAISGLVNGTDYTPSTSSVAVTQPKLVLGFSLKGRKRYLKVSFGAGTSGRIIINTMLADPNDGVASATDAGVTNFFMR